MYRFILLFSLLSFLISCGGSGGSDSAGNGSQSPVDANDHPVAVTGPEWPSNVSLLQAQSEEVEVGPSSFFSKAYFKYDDPGTDYSDDPVNRYVYEDSMESLSIVNEIICYMNQTRASDMVNEGPYIALINGDRCRQGENQSATAETGQSSAGGQTSYETWIVESERADNESPQTVKIWLSDMGDSDDLLEQFILVETVVTEGVSDTDPFGSFSMNFRGVADGTPIDQPGVEINTMSGSLQTVDNEDGTPQFKFINLGGEELDNGIEFGYGFQQAVNVKLDDADGNSGSALTFQRNVSTWNNSGIEEVFEREESYAISYDEDNFLSGYDEDGDTVIEETECRSRTDFDTRVWRYNLYHAENGSFRGADVVEGQRVSLNSGFPFTFDRSGDGVAETHGWIGYQGIWAEDGQALADGQEILEYDYELEANRTHTVATSPGRMTRRSSTEEPLLSFVGEEFQYWGEHPSLNIFDQWVLSVNAEGQFSIVAQLVWGDQGPEYSETIDHDWNEETPEESVSAVLELQEYESLWLWSDALGGDITYIHDPSAELSDRAVTFYQQEFVTADDSLFSQLLEHTLYCYDQCLIGGLTQDDLDAVEGSWELYYQYSEAPYTYTLSLDGGRVVLTDNLAGEAVDMRLLDLSDLGNEWGINTGEMLTEPLPSNAEPWMVYDQPVSYRWESGPNDWNVLATVVSEEGEVVSFDKPLQFNYVHSTENDANGNEDYDGERFMLQYSRTGDLHGIPWVRESEESDRWYPAVTLADEVELDDGTNTFVTKSMEQEQSMSTVDSSECSTLSVTGIFADVDLALPTIADIGVVSFDLASMPEVTDAPAVIEGEIQD